MDRPWSPQEITAKAQQATELRADAVTELIGLATIEAQAGWELRKATAEAYAHMRALPKDDQPRNAEERRAHIEGITNNLRYTLEHSTSQYRNQRDLIRQLSDEMDILRTLLVSHRGVDT